MRNYAPEAVYVDGWVARPGLIRSETPLTVARAIARAGGVKTGAKTRDILLLRRDPSGKLFSYKVALGDFAGAGGEDPLLKSFDIVYVPQTALAAVGEVSRAIQQKPAVLGEFLGQHRAGGGDDDPNPAAGCHCPPDAGDGSATATGSSCRRRRRWSGR